MTTKVQSHLDYQPKKTCLDFIFDYQDLEIIIQISGFSGKERVYINKELVIENRNITSIQSIIDFQYQGQQFTIKVFSTSWRQSLRGIIQVELYIDQQLIDSDQINAFKDSGSPFKLSFKSFLKWMATGAVIGFIAGILIAMLT